ncbi:MAG: hypothetical protein JNN15_11425, partial [Blastocatellia bacterium]|nr:hypothetical protein [Blastocatellia bacterium]
MKRLTFFIIIAILISGCVRSKSKERGGSEVEIAVPPRVTSRTRPELKQAQPYTSPEPFFSHSLDWTLYEKKLEKTKAKVGRKFTVEGFGPFLVVSNLPEKQLQRIKENALRISYNALYRDFFDKRLNRLV